MPCSCSKYAGIFSKSFSIAVIEVGFRWCCVLVYVPRCEMESSFLTSHQQHSAALYSTMKLKKILSFYSALVSHKSITNWHFRSLLAGWLWCDGELLREAWCWYWQCHNFCIMVCHSFRKVEWIAHTIWKEEKETNQLFRKVDQITVLPVVR